MSALALAALSTLILPASAGERWSQTFELDPVALAGGTETPGREELAAVHGRFRYLFASEETRAAFLADPARYGIRQGGACARMGPLSGEGTTRIFTVWDGALYLFASEACRETFLASPGEFVGDDEPLATGTEAERAKARELLDLAAHAAGGARRLDALVSWRRTSAKQVARGGEPIDTGRSLAVLFAPEPHGPPGPQGPLRLRRESWWGRDRWASVVVGAQGWSDDRTAEGAASWPLGPAQVDALRAAFAREPLAILRARDRADFAAFATLSGGPVRVGDAVGERVTVSFDGATTTLAIDPGTGRILAASFRGRGPDLRLGRVERTFGEPQDVGGLLLPVTYRARFEGEPAPALDRAGDTVEVDVELRAALFERPR